MTSAASKTSKLSKASRLAETGAPGKVCGKAEVATGRLATPYRPAIYGYVPPQ